MKRILLIFPFVLLSACTALHEDAGTYADNGNLNQPLQFSDADEEKALDLDEKGRPVVLENKLLYDILVADFANQYGDHERAFSGMMATARRTRDPRLAKRAAEIAVKERNSKEALDAVRLWHQLSPRSAEAEKYLIGFLLIEEGYGELERVISASLSRASASDRGPLMYQYQQLLAGAKDKSKAFIVLESVLAPYENDFESHVALSMLAYSNNDQARAEVEAKKALELKPDSELAVLTLAQAEADPVRSIETLTAFLQKYPNAREVRVSNARMLISQKEYKRARREFEQVLKTDTNDLMTLYSLGLLSIQENDYAAAEKYLRQYLAVSSTEKKSDAETYQVVFLLSQLAEEQKRYDQALKLLTRISEETDAEAWILAQIKRAQILVKKGQVKQARQGLAKLRKDYPTEEERLVLAEAQILRAAKMNRDTYLFLKSSVEKNPTNLHLLYDFSLSAEKVGQYDEMEKALRRILELDPNNHQAYNALGYSLADRNVRLDESYILIAKALALSPDDPYITDSMGWVLFRQGKLKEAELLLRRAYELLPETEVIAHLGEVLWLSGQQAEARQLFESAQAKEPDSDVLKDTLKRLNVRLK